MPALLWRPADAFMIDDERSSYCTSSVPLYICAYLHTLTYVANICRARHGVEVVIFVYKQNSDHWTALCGENIDGINSSACRLYTVKCPVLAAE